MITDITAYRKARQKTAVVPLPDSDEEMEIHGLSAAGYSALLEVQREHKGDNILRAMTVIKWGCDAFASSTVAEVHEAVVLDDAMFLMEKIMDLSGTAEDSEKKS